MSDDEEGTDWERCATWLLSCNILSREQADSITSVDQLAMYLRDGVLLCLLLNRLRPGTIDTKSFSQRPQMSQFLCMKNIRAFLQACSKAFDMKDSALFKPSDLFDMINFNKAIETLSALSKTKIAKKSGIEPFTVENDEIYTIVANEAMDNDIYTDHIYGDSTEDADEEVYGQLIDYRPKGRGPQPATMSKRDHCIKEIMDTENNYVEVLNMVVEKFLEPLKSVVPVSDHEAIFLHVLELRQVHRDLCSDLARAKCSRSTAVESSIPNCFIKHKMNLVIYGKYCSNLTTAQDRLDQCLKMDRVRNLVEKKSEEARVKLRDLLIVPFQRILKYHLLIQELKKHTDEQHLEYPVLEQALTEMLDLSMYVNEVKRDSENLALISEIETSICDLAKYLPKETRLRHYGRRLYDGELKVKPQKAKGFETRYIFLFDKVMLICQARGDCYYYKDVVILSFYKLEELPPDKGMFCFGLVSISQRPEEQGKSYVFKGKNDDLMRKWMDTVFLAESNTSPPGYNSDGHSFRMYTFDEPTTCDVCKKLLRGVFFQGYKCQNTGLSVHKECISRLSESKNLQKNAKVKATAMYEGNPPPPGRGRKVLKFNVGDVIVVLDVDGSWIQGRFNDDEGYFPKDKVRVIKQVERKGSYVEPKPVARQPPEKGSDRPPLPGRKVGSQDSSEAGQLWFAGPISRQTAATELQDAQDGTFLIRFNPEKTDYALTIKYKGDRQSIRHIRINKDDTGFYLTASVAFQTLGKLVDYYKNNSLQESFPNLQTCLSIPYKTVSKKQEGAKNELGVVGYCIALYDYSATEANQLSFVTDDKIAILTKTCNYPQWWRGRLGGKVGYVPSNYVKEL